MTSNSNDASSLDALMRRATAQIGSDKPLPPVETWQPDFCGDLDIEIKADGSWFYMGTPIGRAPLVRLFSTVLRKDADGKTYLVTPVEKIGIRVEDAHFIAVEMTATGQGATQVLSLRTNVGDVVEIGAAHPLRFEIEAETLGLKPYILIRGRLEALVSRAVMYELVALGEEMMVDGVLMFVLRSNGQIFPVMPVEALQQAPITE